MRKWQKPMELGRKFILYSADYYYQIPFWIRDCCMLCHVTQKKSWIKINVNNGNMWQVQRFFEQIHCWHSKSFGVIVARTWSFENGGRLIDFYFVPIFLADWLNNLWEIERNFKEDFTQLEFNKKLNKFHSPLRKNLLALLLVSLISRVFLLLGKSTRNN